jgi:hypothetical protein
MTKEMILAALDKPLTLSSLSAIVTQRRTAPGSLQQLLLEMRDEGLVKFDIKRELWSRVWTPRAP